MLQRYNGNWYVVLFTEPDDTVSNYVNFDTALQKLGGPSEDVKVVTTGKGWKLLLVNRSNYPLFLEAEDIEDLLEDEIILDQAAYDKAISARMFDEWTNHYSEVIKSFVDSGKATIEAIKPYENKSLAELVELAEQDEIASGLVTELESKAIGI